MAGSRCGRNRQPPSLARLVKLLDSPAVIAGVPGCTRQSSRAVISSLADSQRSVPQRFGAGLLRLGRAMPQGRPSHGRLPWSSPRRIASPRINEHRKAQRGFAAGHEKTRPFLERTITGTPLLARNRTIDAPSSALQAEFASPSATGRPRRPTRGVDSPVAFLEGIGRQSPDIAAGPATI